tara:strand:+ start:500 stop:736 length:237 start_codon:yes stop_codon:yes gene_type:complete
MPIYTLKDTKTQDEWDVQMSYDDLQIVLDANPEFLHVLKPLKIAANAGRSNLSRAGDGWKDVLKEVKKNSGRRSNINV